jgi:hypothetical protein
MLSQPDAFTPEYFAAEHFLSQWEQLNALSTVWILLCLFKWFDIEHL